MPTMPPLADPEAYEYFKRLEREKDAKGDPLAKYRSIMDLMPDEQTPEAMKYDIMDQPVGPGREYLQKIDQWLGENVAVPMDEAGMGEAGVGLAALGSGAAHMAIPETGLDWAGTVVPFGKLKAASKEAKASKAEKAAEAVPLSKDEMAAQRKAQNEAVLRQMKERALAPGVSEHGGGGMLEKMLADREARQKGFKSASDQTPAPTRKKTETRRANAGKSTVLRVDEDFPEFKTEFDQLSERAMDAIQNPRFTDISDAEDILKRAKELQSRMDKKFPGREMDIPTVVHDAQRAAERVMKSSASNRAAHVINDLNKPLDQYELIKMLMQSERDFASDPAVLSLVRQHFNDAFKREGLDMKPILDMMIKDKK